MAQSQLPRRLRRTRIVAKQDDFNVGMKQRPALQRVALDDCAMSDERFCRGEKGKHPSPYAYPVSVSIRIGKL
jgi:hypothetical protein